MNGRRRGAAVLVGAALALVALPAGAATGPAPARPPAHIGGVTVSNATPMRGSEIDVRSKGWSPGAGVVISFAGRDLMRTTADDHGVVRAHLTIPGDARPGVDLLSVTGRAASGVPQQIVTGVSVVVDRPARRSERPWGIVLALAAVAAILLLASRRMERVATARRAPAG